MELIDFKSLQDRADLISADFQKAKPFHFTAFEGLFTEAAAERILGEYPTIKDGIWDGTTYIDQKNKFQKTTFEDDSIFNGVFKELNSDEFIQWLQKITRIPDLVGDPELFGGGLHQSINGAFLNVHVDYNVHPKTRFHRRLNVIVYMNQAWEEEYEGYLELWNLSGGDKVLLAKYAPHLNRCVIFETNEISYHGHPKPLNTPNGVSRKSIATYYYSETRPANEIFDSHNTVYINTEGIVGQVRRLLSGIKAFLERIMK